MLHEKEVNITVVCFDLHFKIAYFRGHEPDKIDLPGGKIYAASSIVVGIGYPVTIPTRYTLSVSTVLTGIAAVAACDRRRDQKEVEEEGEKTKSLHIFEQQYYIDCSTQTHARVRK